MQIAGLEGELSILVAAAARAGFVDVLSDTESQLTVRCLLSLK